MNATLSTQHQDFVLRFDPLFVEGHGYAFPCDERGHVDLDRMSDRVRNNYFFARTVIGRALSLPQVVRA